MPVAPTWNARTTPVATPRLPATTLRQTAASRPSPVPVARCKLTTRCRRSIIFSLFLVMFMRMLLFCQHYMQQVICIFDVGTLACHHLFWHECPDFFDLPPLESTYIIRHSFLTIVYPSIFILCTASSHSSADPRSAPTTTSVSPSSQDTPRLSATPLPLPAPPRVRQAAPASPIIPIPVVLAAVPSAPSVIWRRLGSV